MADELFDDGTLWKMYSPKPNPWFSNEIVYEGWGIATFEKPAGTIEGKTKIVVDETGNLDVVMEYERLNTVVTMHGIGNFRFLKFLQANLSENNFVGIGVGNINPCSGLIVQTDNGSFVSEGKIFYSEGFGFDSKLRFLISAGNYRETIGGNPKYWVAPLTNFVSTFHQFDHPSLAQHPLRLLLTPTIPEVVDERHKQIAFLAALNTNLLIGFDFDESVGFIQPVLEYKEKEEKLKSGQIKRCITALMISEVTSKLENVWFPYDYTNLISFAIGCNVGASWIEFRDESGKLVNRKHISQLKDEYKKGYAVIDEGVHDGLGRLLSSANNSTAFGKTYFRVLISHLVRLQSYSRQIEDCMDLLCRTFDTLCEEFGLSVQNLAKSLPLDHQIKINSILRNAQEETRNLAANLSSEMQPVLQQIESRIANAKNTDRAFGLAVLDLLAKYELPDPSIMERYYALDSTMQSKSWAQALTKYRGAAIHTGYFSQEKYNIYDVLKLEDHLQDILIRIALKILGYTGTYQPRVMQYLIDGKTMNWINEDTLASELGYTSPIT